jgi:hypothetical protein
MSPWIDRAEPGVVVPIPTLLEEESYTNPDVSIAKPPANVEVAVDVEVNAPAKKMSPWIDRAEPGVVVPIPTLPAVLIEIVEVPTAVFVSLKYVTWPVDPVTVLPPTHVPPIEKQPSVRSIPVAKVEVADEPVWLR